MGPLLKSKYSGQSKSIRVTAGNYEFLTGRDRHITDADKIIGKFTTPEQRVILNKVKNLPRSEDGCSLSS